MIRTSALELIRLLLYPVRKPQLLIEGGVKALPFLTGFVSVLDLTGLLR
jgi:hypothetical protein